MSAIALFLIALSASTKAIVGTDGVLIRWLGTKRFIPLSEIESVARMPARVRLYLKGGKSYDLFFRSSENTDVPEAGLLAERVQEALDRRGALHALDRSVLTRPDGDAASWIASLRTLVREGTFRDAAVSAEQLWQLVEDPLLDPAQRAAAAVALTPSLAEAGKARLRVVASSTAAPKLRIAFEAAAEGDDAELAEILDDVAKPKRQTNS